MTQNNSFLTERRRAILATIVEFRQKEGYAPSLRQIGQRVGLQSQSSVSVQILALENAGYVRTARDERGFRRAHTLTTTEKADAFIQALTPKHP